MVAQRILPATAALTINTRGVGFTPRFESDMGARSRLEKQPTDLRQNACYFGDRTIVCETIGNPCANVIICGGIDLSFSRESWDYKSLF
jgi:hypothetical protein